MYADDTVLYAGNLDTKQLRKGVQQDLCSVQNWCNRNKLTLNIKKTKYMTFMSDKKRKNHKGFKMYIKGNLLEEVQNPINLYDNF